MSAIKIIQAYAKKQLTKNRGSGIMELPSDMVTEARTGEIAAMLQRAGIPVEQLDQFIRSEKDLLKYLNIIEATSKPNYTVFSGQKAADQLNKLFPKKGEVVDMSGKKLDSSKPIMGGTQDDSVTGIMTQIDDRMKNINKANDRLTELLNEREIIYGKAPKTKDNPKVQEREMFKEANEKFNKTDMVADTVTRIISMEPVAALKEANKIIGRKGIYKNLTEEQSQKILKDTDDWIFQRDPSDLYDYKKNRPFRDDPDFDPDDPDFDPEQGFYTGGMVDVEPSLSDIGHGSDALMARTRLVSPNSQATTSTGLNYLLAEDNDNIRVPFAAGGGGRRAFLKLMATLGGGIAGIKTGLLGLGGKETGKQVAKEVVKSAGSGQPPPYFFNLVNKIKTLGDDTMATQDNTIAKKYKDYVMEEDFSGNITIIKQNLDDPYPEEVIMSYKVDDVSLPGGKGMAKVDEYEEFTARPDMDGKMKDVEPGVPDEVIEEGTMFEDNFKDFGKAEGGRINFMGGGLANVLARLGIKGSSRRFLEKAFGKERFANMIENDPELHRGLLEVVEMFRNRDKEGLKMYMQKFLPHMDDAEVEQFIIGSTPDIEGLTGQLTRLGSGRDYAGKLEMIKKADEVKKLQDFDIKNVTKNAEGGRIGFSGGGIFRAIIAKAAAAKGMKPYEFIKVTSYKSLPREIKMFMSAEDFAKLKSGQKDMYSNYIDMAKTRKDFQQQVEAGKKTPASPIFDYMEKTMDKQSYVPKTVTADDIAEMELMVKNRFNKGRKDNALGGLQTMLGE